jgi:hypothetical protein
MIGSHVWQIHGYESARDYRKEFGYDVKKGQLESNLHKLKASQVFENGTVKNLKIGKKYWFKPGDKKAGRYIRSPETMTRLKTLKIRSKK